MRPFIHPDDAAAYALGAVTPLERRAFEQMVASDASLARTVEDYARIAAMLGLAAPAADPPEDLRRRILDSIPSAR
jgi:anti-sigma-K factor RskA